MRKILISLLAVAGTSSVFAANNLFQEFDDQYNIGYGMSQTTLSNGTGPDAQGTNQSLNLEVERLFDNGIWGDVTANLVTNSQQNGGGAGYTNSTTQVPNLGGINAKIGYAFPVAGQHLQFIPYVTMGRNTNLAQSVVINNGASNISNDFFYTAGAGGRIEYRVNRNIELYADQAIVYNWDQSGPLNGIEPQNNMLYTTTLGLKYNVTGNLQLGLSGFYNNQQNLAAEPMTPTGPAYNATDGFGGLVTIGLTY